MTIHRAPRSTPLGKTGPSVFPIGLGCMAMSDIAALEDIVPADAIGGARYPAQHMKDLDSER